MRFTVSTRYLPATNTLGARVSVVGEGTNGRFPWDHAVDTQQNHVNAAIAFARTKLEVTDDLTVAAVTGRSTAGGYLVTLSTFAAEEPRVRPVVPGHVMSGPFALRRNENGVITIRHTNELGTDKLILSRDDAHLLAELISGLTQTEEG